MLGLDSRLGLGRCHRLSFDLRLDGRDLGLGDRRFSLDGHLRLGYRLRLWLDRRDRLGLGLDRRQGLCLGLLLRHRRVARDRERHLRSPARRLELDDASGVVGLPLDLRLGLDVGDADLAQLAEVTHEGVGIAQLRPQLGR